MNTLFDGLQPLVNNQVTKLPIPLIGDALSTAGTAQVFDSLAATSNAKIPAALATRNDVKMAIQDAFGANVTDNPDDSFSFTISGSKPLGSLAFDPALDFLDLDNYSTTVDATLGYDVVVRILVDDTKVEFVPTTPDEIKLHLSVDTANLGGSADFGFLKAQLDAVPGSTVAKLDLLADIPGTTPIAAANISTVTLNPSLNGDFQAAIQMRANFLGFAGDGTPLPGFNPTLLADFNFDWQFADVSYTTSDPLIEKGDLSASFDNVKLDLGSAVKSVISPVAEQIDRFAGGLLRLAEPLTKPIPALEKVGSPITSVRGMLAEVARLTGNADLKTGLEVLDQFAFLAGLAGTARDIAASGMLDLGSFQLAGAGFDPQTPGSKLSDLQLNDANQNEESNTYGKAQAAIGSLLADLKTYDVGLPLIEDPTQAFSILLGKPDVDLVTYDARFAANLGRIELFQFSFAIGPVPVQVTADFDTQFSASLQIGFDTSGIFGAGHNAADGFFLRNLPGESLFSLMPKLEGRAGAGNRKIARIGVGAELTATLSASLGDGSTDKVRLTELEELLKSGCALALSGSIDFTLNGFIEYICGARLYPPKLKYCEKTRDFGTFNIYNFATACNPRSVNAEGQVADPPLARVDDDGTLYLFIGPRASMRDNMFLDVIDETITVSGATDGKDGKVANDGKVLVSGFGLEPQMFEGVRRIVADGGTGNDVITLDGVSYPAYLEGGDGDDQISAALGSATILGGSGNDNLAGGSSADLIDGGLGNDILTAGLGNDTLLGGLGDDSLDGDATPGPMDPTPSTNNNYLDGGEGNDALNGGSGNDTLMGGDGDDTLDGGSGDDLLVGGNDADTFFYGVASGNQEIDGGSGDDVFIAFGSDGADVFSLDASQAQSIFDRGAASALISGVGSVTILPGDGSDLVSIGDLTGTTVTGVTVFLGLAPSGDGSTDETPRGPLAPDSGDDTVVVAGTLLDDAIRVAPVIAPSNAPDAQLTNGALRVSGTAAAVLVADTSLADKITVRGTSGDDDLRSSPSSDLTPQIEVESLVQIQLEGGEGNDYLSADATLLGGAGDDVLVPLTGTNVVDGQAGFDTILITGSAGADTILVTGPASNLIINNSASGSSTNTVSNVEIIRIEAQGGVDTVILAGLSIEAIVESGDGNDVVDASAVLAVPLTILGGSGDDTLVGGSQVDRIEGGDGNDSITGSGGGDTLLGGDGSDTFVWNPGDGSDRVEGESGQNLLQFNGADGVDDTMVLSANGTRLRLDRQPGNVVMDIAGVQQVDLNAGSGGDTVTINNLEDTEVATIRLTLGAIATPYLPDSARDNVVINGRNSPNDVSLTLAAVPGEPAGTNQVDVEGLGQRILVGGSTAECPLGPTDDILTINTGIADDHVIAASGVENQIGMVINVGDGDDFVRASATINGGSGDDMLLGAGGSCGIRIDGGDGDDMLIGNDGGDDTLIASSGNDLVYGLGGNDSISGGEGRDFLVAGGGDDIVDGGDGNDILLGGAGNDSLDGGSGKDLLLGDADAESRTVMIIAIDSGHGDDTLLGGSGDDMISGDFGNDLLMGGDGNDLLGVVTMGGTTFADPGEDTMQGGSGDDVLHGSTGDDTLSGDDGNDLIVGDEGADFLAGGNGNDVLMASSGDDTAIGGAGDDYLIGGDGNDILLGDADAPSGTRTVVALAAGHGDDTLDGGAGNDQINGDLGNDLLVGGDGNDVLGPAFVQSVAFTEHGDDSLFGGNGADILIGSEGNDTLSGDADNDLLMGDAGNDVLYGGLGLDNLSGGLGEDVLSGDEGDDRLLGNAGNDWLFGGLGDDLLLGDTGTDILSGGDGNDILDGGDDNDTAYGGAGNDLLRGSSGNDALSGDDGDDIIEGGTGHDMAFGGSGNDTLTGGDGNDALSGDDGDDVLLGQLGDDWIEGGSGKDQLWGSDGNDNLGGGDGDDLLVGGDGDDQLRGGLGDDVVMGQNGADLIYGGRGNDFLYGGVGADRIFGGDGVPANVPHQTPPTSPNDGNDVLSGGADHDMLDGGNGNNILDAGNDSIREVVVAGPGDDIGFAHCNRRDGRSDRFGVDGGTNRVYLAGALQDPADPVESTSRVVVTVVAPRPRGQFVFHPGDPKKLHDDPLPRTFRPKLRKKVTVRKTQRPFAGRKLSAGKASRTG